MPTNRISVNYGGKAERAKSTLARPFKTIKYAKCFCGQDITNTGISKTNAKLKDLSQTLETEKDRLAPDEKQAKTTEGLKRIRDHITANPTNSATYKTQMLVDFMYNCFEVAETPLNEEILTLLNTIAHQCNTSHTSINDLLATSATLKMADSDDDGDEAEQIIPPNVATPATRTTDPTQLLSSKTPDEEKAFISRVTTEIDFSELTRDAQNLPQLFKDQLSHLQTTQEKKVLLDSASVTKSPAQAILLYQLMTSSLKETDEQTLTFTKSLTTEDCLLASQLCVTNNLPIQTAIPLISNPYIKALLQTNPTNCRANKEFITFLVELSKVADTTKNEKDVGYICKTIAVSPWSTRIQDKLKQLTETDLRSLHDDGSTHLSAVKKSCEEVITQDLQTKLPQLDNGQKLGETCAANNDIHPQINLHLLTLMTQTPLPTESKTEIETSLKTCNAITDLRQSLLAKGLPIPEMTLSPETLLSEQLKTELDVLRTYKNVHDSQVDLRADITKLRENPQTLAKLKTRIAMHILANGTPNNTVQLNSKLDATLAFIYSMSDKNEGSKEETTVRTQLKNCIDTFEKVNGFPLRPNQVVSIMLMCWSQIDEATPQTFDIPTGNGKAAIARVVSATNLKVDHALGPPRNTRTHMVLVPNPSLQQSDCRLAKEYLKALGIDAVEAEDYDPKTNTPRSPQVLYATPSRAVGLAEDGKIDLNNISVITDEYDIEFDDHKTNALAQTKTAPFAGVTKYWYAKLAEKCKQLAGTPGSDQPSTNEAQLTQDLMKTECFPDYQNLIQEALNKLNDPQQKINDEDSTKLKTAIQAFQSNKNTKTTEKLITTIKEFKKQARPASILNCLNAFTEIMEHTLAHKKMLVTDAFNEMIMHPFTDKDKDPPIPYATKKEYVCADLAKTWLAGMKENQEFVPLPCLHDSVFDPCLALDTEPALKKTIKSNIQTIATAKTNKEIIDAYKSLVDTLKTIKPTTIDIAEMIAKIHQNVLTPFYQKLADEYPKNSSILEEIRTLEFSGKAAVVTGGNQIQTNMVFSSVGQQITAAVLSKDQHLASVRPKQIRSQRMTHHSLFLQLFNGENSHIVGMSGSTLEPTKAAQLFGVEPSRLDACVIQPFTPSKLHANPDITLSETPSYQERALNVLNAILHNQNEGRTCANLVLGNGIDDTIHLQAAVETLVAALQAGTSKAELQTQLNIPLNDVTYPQLTTLAQTLTVNATPYLADPWNENDTEIPEKPLAANCLQFASSFAGSRGTDWSFDQTATQGLHTIVTCELPNPNSYIQAVGRSGRKGDPGSATIFVTQDKSELLGEEAQGQALSRYIESVRDGKKNTTTLEIITGKNEQNQLETLQAAAKQEFISHVEKMTEDYLKEKDTIISGTKDQSTLAKLLTLRREISTANGRLDTAHDDFLSKRNTLDTYLNQLPTIMIGTSQDQHTAQKRIDKKERQLKTAKDTFHQNINHQFELYQLAMAAFT
ncbi:MAG: hypothetical protein VW378_03235 [bacterium]